MTTTTTGKISQRVRTERQQVSLSDFAAEIVRLDEASETQNILIHGDSSVGKTWLASTLPGKQFWLVAEPGYKVAGRRGIKGGARRINDTATALAAIDWLNAGDRCTRLDWLVVDGGSTMQDRIRAAYAAEAFDVSGGTKRQHRNLPDKPDYFNTQNFLKSWYAQLVDLPVNLLVTAHSYRTDKTENGELVVFPGFQGKVTETANAIAGLMDVVGYYEARRMRNRKTRETVLRRRLWFESPDHDDDVRYICGDKFNCLGPYIDYPTMPILLDKINGEG